MNRRFIIGIGTNLGDRLANLRTAITGFAAFPGTTVARRSHVWETSPLGPGSGPFLNAAAELICEDTDPGDLLERLLGIERRLGRLRRERWGDRILDLDLLCGFDGETELVIDRPGLTLPHPEIASRDFVLRPLLDLDPDLVIGGRHCAELLAALADDQRTILRRLDVGLG